MRIYSGKPLVNHPKLIINYSSHFTIEFNEKRKQILVTFKRDPQVKSELRGELRNNTGVIQPEACILFQMDEYGVNF